MQYLVTMTTHVPDGVSDGAVDDIRSREAARSGELASAGHLLRLWRPPLEPGEWRTLGLFDADDESQLETVLSSMPLRIWRHDSVTPLSAHPNDPPAPTRRQRGTPEFLTTFTRTNPDGVGRGLVAEAEVAEAEVAEAEVAEARQARALAEQGYLVRLWRLPGKGRALGLWQAEEAGRLQAILDELPLRPWLQIETIPLTEHPSDPARSGARG
jgi:muconolactone delta-isomerase